MVEIDLEETENVTEFIYYDTGKSVSTIVLI